MDAASPLEKIVWGTLALVIAAIAAAFYFSSKAPASPPLPVYSQIADFSLTNQSGRAISLADFKGRIWVADIIFTRCAGPCPTMTREMAALQQALPAAIQLITLTTDPEFDTPAVLKSYGEQFKAHFDRWHFLTGSKREIGRLAIDGLKLTALDVPAEKRANDTDLFVHSTIFVLVDKQARVRGTFESDAPDFKTKLIAAIHQLEQEK
jgi:protein SCO1/2